MENAFFHGFPEGRRGTIQIFVKEEAENLRFEIIDDGVAKLPDKSSFAGSIATMDKAFRFAVCDVGLPIEDVSKMMSLNQAKLMKIDRKKGSIAKGKDADFVVLDDGFNVAGVYVRAVKKA